MAHCADDVLEFVQDFGATYRATMAEASRLRSEQMKGRPERLFKEIAPQACARVQRQASIATS